MKIKKKEKGKRNRIWESTSLRKEYDQNDGERKGEEGWGSDVKELSLFFGRDLGPDPFIVLLSIGS